jgi:hypothetical protein
MNIDHFLSKLDAERKIEKANAREQQRQALTKLLPVGWPPEVGRLLLLESTAVEKSDRGDLVYRMRPLAVHGFCKIPMAVGDARTGPVVFVQSRRLLSVAEITHVHNKNDRVHYVARPVARTPDARAFLLDVASELTKAIELSKELRGGREPLLAASMIRDVLLLIEASP